MGDLSKNFSISEMCCPCCGKCDMDAKFIKILQKARSKAGIPFIINSGYRCESHNKEVGGVSNSSHLIGKAVDIRVMTSIGRLHIVKSLLEVGFSRIKIYGTWVHVDNDYSKSNGLFL